MGPGADNGDEEERFCFNCHDGSLASTNLQAEFAKGTNTATRTYHHPVDDDNQFTRAVECTDCRKPHQATSSNVLKGVTGTDLDGNAVSTPVEYEVCLNCHGDTYQASRDINGDGFDDTSNKRLDIAANASAYHPVQQAGRNTSGALQAQLLGGLTTSSTMRCSDCHNNQATADAQGLASNSTASPQGPHGSTIYPILRASSDLRAIQPEGSATTSQFALCFLCHSQSLMTARRFSDGSRTNFYGASKESLHWFHLTNNGGVTCRSCHFSTHGNQSAGNTIYRIIDGGTTDYNSPPVGYKTRMVNFSGAIGARGFAKPMFQINVSTRWRSCDLVCHGTDHVLNDGDFTYNAFAEHGQPGQDNDPLTYVP